jgi:hypothetical protein
MKKKKFYYLFSITSSRGTDERHVRMYDEKPSEETLKSDVKDWASGFTAWQVSENHISYGWKPIKSPKNRAECLKRHDKACKLRAKWNEERRLYAGLLGHPPFNGT